MTKNNNLVLVNNSEIIEKIKKECEESSNTFLFPIEGFCVGIPNCFKIKDIKEKGYIFINRLLDKKGIKQFKELLNALPNNIKGIVFDDIGILNILTEIKSPLTKILFLNHMNCNYKSINSFLEYVDSVVISTDITKTEIEEILKKAKKNLVLYAFGHVAIMYSRRTLLTNYNKHFNKKISTETVLTESISKKNVRAIENIYGTVIYTSEPFNNLTLRNSDNIFYNMINTLFIPDDDIIKILNNEDNLENKYPYKYLSEEETIFKIKEGNI